MANNLSNYLQSQLLTWFKGTAFATAPTNTYVALYTVAPTNAGGGTEVTGGSYARVAIASTGWSAVTGTSPSAISNSAAVTFPTATASWGTVVAVGIFDASTGGNLLYQGALTSSQTVANGNTFQFAASALSLQAD